tara:strand:+ start:87 stop:725 length:639 start_codon:yes stop_codon:yes gene_type:complete
MAQLVLKSIKNAVNHWYIPFIVGLLFVILAIYSLVTPEKSFLALTYIFSISFILTGIAEIAFSYANKKKMDSWIWTLLFGVITTVFGFIMLIRPEISIATLPLYIGFLVMFRSVNAISLALDLKNYGISATNNLMWAGILGLVFSIILIWNPGFAGLTLVFWISFVLFWAGTLSLYLGTFLYKIHKSPTALSENLEKRLAELQNDIKDHFNK